MGKNGAKKHPLKDDAASKGGFSECQSIAGEQSTGILAIPVPTAGIAGFINPG
jgi:hypothetical protein